MSAFAGALRRVRPVCHVFLKREEFTMATLLRFGRKGSLVIGLVATLLAPSLAPPALAQRVAELKLVSDVPGLAFRTDPNLVNPWGISFSATSPFWISDNHAGVSTLYNSFGGKAPLVVNVPLPPGVTGLASPTGQVFNSTAFSSTPGFVLGTTSD